MKLTTEEVAKMLGVPVSTIDRWIAQGSIPVVRMGNEYVFNRQKLEAWARANYLRLNTRRAQSTDEKFRLPSLRDAISRGGVHFDVGGSDIAGVLSSAVQLAPVPEESRGELLERLLEREKLSPTGIGHGVAIPHPRTPLASIQQDALITVCFLAEPVDFKAVDGKPVFVVFLMICPTTKAHLHLLSRLAFCLRDDEFVRLLESRPPGEKLIAELERRESQMDASQRP